MFEVSKDILSELNTVVYHLQGPLDATNYRLLQDELEPDIHTQGRKIVLELDPTEAVDVLGASILVIASCDCILASAILAIVMPEASRPETLKINGLTASLPTYETVESAVADLTRKRE